MASEVIIKNSVLDGTRTTTDIESLFDSPIGEEDNVKFLLGHGGVEQMKTHGGLEADVKIVYDERDAWGATGREMGKEFARLISERNEQTYKRGFSTIVFGKIVSTVAIRKSRKPTVHFYFDTEGLDNQRDIEIADSMRSGVRDYLMEFANLVSADLFVLTAPFERFRTPDSKPYGDSLGDLHHRAEGTFKALANAFRQFKARRMMGLGGVPLEPRIAYLLTSHGEAQMGCFVNLDGRGEAVVELPSVLDRAYLRRFGGYQKIMAKRGMMDSIIVCRSIGRHHTIEDEGIPQGQAFSQAIRSNRSRLVRFGNDFYIDDKQFVLAGIGVSNRFSFVGNYTPEFMKSNDTTLHYLEQMLQDARWETYLHVGSPDFEQTAFNDPTAYEILHEVFKPNSEYLEPSNTIRPYENPKLEDPCAALFYVLGGAIRMGTRIDRSQPEGAASSKGVTY